MLKEIPCNYSITLSLHQRTASRHRMSNPIHPLIMIQTTIVHYPSIQPILSSPKPHLPVQYVLIHHDSGTRTNPLIGVKFSLATSVFHVSVSESRHPLPKGDRGLCFIAVSISEETSYICSTEGSKAALKMFIAALMSRSW